MALAQGRTLPDRMEGAGLFADISGFTPLTEALVREFGPQRGAEELTRQLNQVYDALVNELHRYGGSVISFSGDAITCWFDEDTGLLAVTCALEMQEAMKGFASITIPAARRDGPAIQVSLAMKAAVAVGTARRFVVGDPKLQRIDVLAGTTLDRLAAGEHHANKGEVVVDQATAEAVGDLSICEWREDHETGERFAVVEEVDSAITLNHLSPFAETLSQETVKDWLLPPVYERLRRGQGDFLAELRPAVSVFVRFGGIDYDDDEAAGEKLDAYIRWAQNALAEYDGYLLQLTVGDKGSYLMSTFGAPVAHENDAVRAVSAALKLVDTPAHLSFIQNVQIGIAMGRTRAGAYGGTARRTYGVMGDEVNLAARLMQGAPVGQILVSEGVRQATGNLFNWESLPPMRVKGKAEPVHVARAVGLRTRRTFHLQVPEYKLPMVGREDNLAFVQKALENAKSGQGQIVALLGEAGVGKTRLLAEVIRFGTEQNLVGLGGECESFGTETSYLVWQPIWRGFFELDPSWGLKEQIEAIETNLRNIDPALVQRLPLLGTVLNLPIPDNDLTQSFDARLRKTSLEALLVDCLEARAKNHPLLIVLEDCQWLDPLSHDLLEIIGRAVLHLPVMIVLTMRPPELARLQEEKISKLPNYAEIPLRAFDVEEAKKLIGLKLAQFSVQPGAFPPKITNRIIDRAQGNPFYIEELLNYLFNQKDIGESLTLTLDLPTSLHSLILSRLDQLTESQKTTLKVASVIGRLFRVALLWGAYPSLGDQTRVQTDLQTLQQLQLTSLDPSEPELAYFFRQIVTQEVAYESLPFSTRATLHSQLAQSIEHEYRQSLDQFVELLAFHYLRGQEWEKSLEYNLRAAQTTQKEYANEASILACQRALDSASRLPDDRDTSTERLAVHEILGDVLTLTGKYDEALENYATARVIVHDLPPHPEQTSRLADLCRKIAEVYERRSEYETAFEWLEKGLKYLSADQATVEAARMYLLGAGVYHRQGKNHDAMAWSEKSLELASQITSREGQRVMAQTSYLQGAIHYRLGNFWGAVASCQRSVELYQEIEEVPGMAKALNNLAIAYNDLGNWEQASDVYHKSLEVNQQIGSIQEQGFIANNLATIHLDRGEWEEAAHLFKESNDIWKQLGASLPEAVTMSNLAQVYIYQQNWKEAETALQTSETLFTEIGSDDYLPELKRRWGDYFLHTGQLAQALQQTQESIELARTQEARLDEGISYRILGEIYRSQNLFSDSKTALGQGLDILMELESEYEAAKTRLSLAKLWSAEDAATARKFVLEAQQSFQKLGAKADLAEAENLLSMLPTY